MRRLISASLLALVVLGIFGTGVASAQQQVSFSVGGFSPRSEDARTNSDVLVNNLDFLAFRISDFSGPLFGAEYLTTLGNNFDGASASGSISGRCRRYTPTSPTATAVRSSRT